MSIQTTTTEAQKPPLDKESSVVVVHRLVSPLPCPHCGSSAGLRYYTHDPKRCYYACDDSRCHHTYLDPMDALDAWNRRANK
jgi:hypothetical protein